MAVFERLQSTAELVKTGGWEHLRQAGRERLHSETRAFGLKRDISVPFAAPDATIPITVRAIRPSDVSLLLEAGREELTVDAQRDRFVRMRLIESELATCYVAVTENDEPCYMQWLIGSRENRRVHDLFGDRFPALASNEMLLEGAFTLEKWRGKKIMAAAMARIAEFALDHDARWVITFVGEDNIPSLKGCKRAGFEPYIERTGTWRAFRYKATFSPLREESLTAMSAD